MIHCEPYQSCSLFGAMRYFSNLKNCITLINGPAGCTFYANNAIIRLNGYFNAPEKVEIPKVYCVDFNEKDAILGSEDKLYNASVELIKKFHPEVLLLFNCCVSEIIGSDIDDIAEKLMELYTDVLVLPLHTAGFKGDHKYGMRLASEVLVNFVFPEKSTIRKGMINLLGEFDYFNRSTVELRDFLENIGITQINYIPGKSSLKELRDAPNAELNIISCQNASRHLAELMKEKYGIPCLGDGSNLYGIENTHKLYSAICDFYKINKEITNAMRERALLAIAPFQQKLKGKSAVVVAGTRRALGYSAILQELGVEIKMIFSEADETQTRKTEFLQYSHNVMYNEYANELAETIEELDADYVFSTIPEIIAPVSYLRRPEIDYSGMEGCVRMAKFLARLEDAKTQFFIDE